jgi:hypothetical protein
MRWVGNVALMWERTGVYKIVVGKPEGKRLLGRPRLGLKDNIKKHIKEV